MLLEKKVAHELFATFSFLLTFLGNLIPCGKLHSETILVMIEDQYDYYLLPVHHAQTPLYLNSFAFHTNL